ncbi:MAG TPA: S9 family peptidase, partial [Thermococcus paralvinellae]|nr:S9 family peptidase [Thermococcus paralvinellae]
KKLSPLFYVGNVKAPILLIHSLEDYRCPLDQSVMFYHTLKDLGKEAYIAIFKRGAHGHSIRGSPRHRAKRYKLFMEFFERKLKRYEEGFDVEKILKGKD